MIFSQVGPFCVICALLRSGTYWITPAACALRRWLFLLGLIPFRVAVGAVSGFLSDETQIWLGDLRVVGFGVSCVSFVMVSAFCGLLLVHGHGVMATVLCTVSALTASTSVRTEPRATSAVPEEKKIGLAWSSLYNKSFQYKSDHLVPAPNAAFDGFVPKIAEPPSLSNSIRIILGITTIEPTEKSPKDTPSQ